MKSHLIVNKNNNYYKSNLFNNKGFFLPGTQQKFIYNDYLYNIISNINNNNNYFSNRDLNLYNSNNISMNEIFSNINLNQLNLINHRNSYEKLLNYNNNLIDNYNNKILFNNNSNYISNMNMDGKALYTIKKEDSECLNNNEGFNKEYKLIKFNENENKIIDYYQLKIENPISFCIIVTDNNSE